MLQADDIRSRFEDKITQVRTLPLQLFKAPPNHVCVCACV